MIVNSEFAHALVHILPALVWLDVRREIVIPFDDPGEIKPVGASLPFGATPLFDLI